MVLSDNIFAAFGRVALTLLALTTLAVAVFVAGSALRLVPLGELHLGNTSLTLGLADLPMTQRLAWLGGAALTGLLALALVPSVLRFGDNRLITLSTSRRSGMMGGGSIAVSSRSLHALAAYRAESVPGVLEALTRLKLKRKGWYVDLQVVLTQKAHVQEVGAELRTAMQDAMQSHTGYPVARLRVWAQLNPLSKRKRVY